MDTVEMRDTRLRELKQLLNRSITLKSSLTDKVTSKYSSQNNHCHTVEMRDTRLRELKQLLNYMEEILL